MGASCDSPFFAQKASIFGMHDPLRFLKCFVHFLTNFDFLSPFWLDKSAKSSVNLDSLPFFHVQMCFSCSGIPQGCSINGLGEVWMVSGCKIPTWGESYDSPFFAQITPKLIPCALQVLGML